MEGNFVFEGKLKQISIVLSVLAVVALGVSFGMNHYVGWVDYLVFALYFTTVSVSSIFFLSLAGVLQASWLTPYKRIPEAMSGFLPYAAGLMLISIAGMGANYEWTHTDIVQNDPILSAKVAWLNTPRFVGTMAFILIVWNLIALRHKKVSEMMDGSNGAEVARKNMGFFAVSILVFALTISCAAFDWIMSVEPHWFSTIFGVYIFAGTFVSGMAFITLTVITLKEQGYLKNVNENHLHDLGKWMFGMSVFWAYIWISQYLLIWYANVPEETEYYVLRHHHWNGLFFFNVVINFVFPFFVLMTRKAKRNATVLKTVAAVLLVGHFLDMYIMVAPKIFHHHDVHHVSGFGVVQILQLLGGFGFFIFIVGRALSKRKLEVTNDPTYAEGAHLHQ